MSENSYCAGGSRPRSGRSCGITRPLGAPEKFTITAFADEEMEVRARNAGIDPVLLDRAGTADGADCPVICDLWGLFDVLEEPVPGDS